MNLASLKNELKRLADSDQAINLCRFFKTGKGEYGEGDKFLGIKVPILRSISKKYRHLNFNDLKKLITSLWHEERFIALLILIDQYKASDEANRQSIYDFYVEHMNLKSEGYINNWDLVDMSAPNIIGQHLFARKRDHLRVWAYDKNLWVRRISIISTFYFIKKNFFDDALKVSNILLDDKHDLIHKAVGWMLREIGKRDLVVEEKFLQKNYKNMPRTMLRYAIEHFPENRRKQYLIGTV